MAKKKAKFPNIAIQSVVEQPSAEADHDTIIVTVANAGQRNAAGFRIGMVAQRADMTVRAEDFSLPLSIAKGASTTVEFRLGCGWINIGAITARTDPSPVPGEPDNKTVNNVETAQFGATACSLGTSHSARQRGAGACPGAALALCCSVKQKCAWTCGVMLAASGNALRESDTQ